ncbi:MAG TPA: hypothetical protein VMS74_03640, partial [Acidimicrobiia bacterium]|nr:hypothetical protein [Acidimicrobiia bacterium]
MDDRRPIEDEVEAAASIVSPLPVAVLALVLDAPESDIVTAVEALETAGRVVATRQGITAGESSLSSARMTHIATRLAAVLEQRQGPLVQIGRAQLAAGEARRAYDVFLRAIEDETTSPQERVDTIGLAIESGVEARVPMRTLAPLFVSRARHRRLRGENDMAVTDLEAATPHLSGEALIDAYGFAAALHDDRQRPADAERTIAMALLVAAEEGSTAKLGSLLTFQGRLLARLGFDAESDRVFTLGAALVDAHGDEMQRHYAGLNQAWTDLDRGWVARAERGYATARSRAAVDDPVAMAEMDIAIARAKFAGGDAQGAIELLAAAERVGEETNAVSVKFLSALARAEGAITFRQPTEAVEAATRLREIVDASFPAWQNRAATVEARALLLAQRRAEARDAIRRGFETTPRGANGMRLRTELEALQLVADERWDDERAADIADRLLQGGWHLAAVTVLTERSRREKRPELGRAAA